MSSVSLSSLSWLAALATCAMLLVQMNAVSAHNNNNDFDYVVEYHSNGEPASSADVVAYISSVSLAAKGGNYHAPDVPVVYSNATDQAVVNRAAGTVFDDTLSATNKFDMALAMLFCQFVADQEADAFEEPVGWYSEYLVCLKRIGFTYSPLTWTKYRAPNTTVTCANAALDTLKPALTRNAYAIVVAALDSLKSDSPALQIYSDASTLGDLGNFQVDVITNISGVLTTTLSGYSFSATSQQYGFLWFDYQSSDIQIKTASTTLVRVEAIWADGEVRDALSGKLGQAVDRYISDMKIKPPPSQQPSTQASTTDFE